MSQNPSEISIKEVERDRCARITKSTIRRKVLETPNFCVQLKSHSDYELFYNLRLNYKTEHLGSITIPYFVAEKTIAPLIRTSEKQLDMNLNPVSNSFLQNTVIGVDPYTEYMKYEWRFKDILESDLTPLLVKQYAREVNTRGKKAITKEQLKDFKLWKTARYRKFWLSSMNDDPSSLVRLIANYFDIEQKCGADYFIPSCPVIDDTDEMLQATITVNDKAKAIKKVDSVATYFLLAFEALSETKIIKGIINYITDNPSKITIIKIKNLDLFQPNNYTAFNNYVGLLREVDLIKRSDPERLFFNLETGYHAYPTLVACSDSISTSVRGLDKDGIFGRPKEHAHSQWFHPKLKVHLTHSETMEMVKLNADTIMDNCPACNEIQTKPNLIIKDNWNPYTKKHYLLTWNSFVSEIRTFIQSHEIEKTRNEIMEDAVNLRKFKDFIPTY
ncbi:hypothetical protein [Candidatus Nitrosotalea okcheonensis]|uniref:Uncharacterized protein n=1 Tax=Candidatus Nitrosotalea okcheonensis TaxID=1903276 RepID=A0A2H1FCG9_9ARCH|nr:hypothetical protein [Candidatus Nitrosotalea okcheonensis]SMH70465.1 protein of unknown function [Candidatus Nitrosotalea okcheonensis]